MRIKTLWDVTLGAAQDWWEDNCLRLAASLAYYTALSLAPLILLIVGLLGVVLERQQVASQLESQLEGLMGPAGRELVTSILATTSPEGGAFAAVVGLVTLFIGATAVFGELQTTMNLIWEVRPAPTEGVWAGIWAWLRERVFSLAIVFALAFLLLVSLVVSAALAGAAALLWGPEQSFLSRLLELLVSLAVLTLGFALLFTYVPDAEVRWRDVWLGGVVTAVLFTLGKTAIGYYLGQASVGSAYGAAGSMVVLLVWVYYSALIVFFGAEFTQAWATRHGGVAPQPHAVSGAAPQAKGEAAAERPRGVVTRAARTHSTVIRRTARARYAYPPHEHSPFPATAPHPRHLRHVPALSAFPTRDISLSAALGDPQSRHLPHHSH